MTAQMIAGLAGIGIGFVAGLGVGLLIGKRDTKSILRTCVVVAVVLVWLASFVVSVAIEGYSTPIEIHAAMGAVIGWLFGVAGVKKMGVVK